MSTQQTKKPEVTKRLLKLAKRIIDGNRSTSTANMRMCEFYDLCKLGFRLQADQGWGEIAGSGKTVFYLLDGPEGRKEALELYNKLALEIQERE